MARYVSRPKRTKAFDDEWYEPPFISDLTVIENEPLPTGLLDANGNEIFRMNDPIGFRIDD